MAEQNDPQLVQNFNKLNNLSMSTYDSLFMKDLPPQKVDALKANIVKYNNALNHISLNVAKNISTVLIDAKTKD